MKNKLWLLLLPFILLAATPSFNDMSVQQAVNIMARYDMGAISMGAVPNVSAITKFGGNGDIGSGTPEVLWEYGGSFTIPTSARTLSVVSSSSADDSGSTGANSVVITGLDADYAPITEIVTLDGITPVVTTNSFTFVNRIAVYLSGSGKKNAGNITATQTTTGTVLGYVKTGNGVTEQLIYQVPAGYKAYFKDLKLSAAKLSGGASPRIVFEVIVFSFVTNTEYVIRTIIMDTAATNQIAISDFKAEPVNAKEIVYIRATSNTAATIAYGSMSGFLQEL